MVSVFGICNPLLDFIAHEDVGLVESMHTRPGTMNLIERGQMETLLSRISRYTNTPGGSGANTVRGLAWLNRQGRVPPPAFCGAVGRDAFGDRYIEIMKSQGVRACMVQKDSPSGCSIIIVTPDRERTMFTYLGACREFTEADVDFSLVGQSRILHITGYMWDTENQKEAVRKTVEVARSCRIPVSFDLADPFVVQRNQAEFRDWIPGRVDILFGNREEFSLLLAGAAADEQLLAESASLAGTVVMKVGADGCLARRGDMWVRAAGFPVQAVDSTGAGDSFASGFLFGLLQGWDLAAAARLANRLAAWIVSIEGCDYNLLAQAGGLEGE